MANNVTGTHCIKGHPMTADNTHVAPDCRKECKQCNHDKRQRYRNEHKEDLAALKAEWFQKYKAERAAYHKKWLAGHPGYKAEWLSNLPDRSPESTVLCRSIQRIWFLFHGRQFHTRFASRASAGGSTGI